MAFYQVSGSKRFSVSNPTNQIEVQLEQLQAKLDALSTSSPSTRLFLNYPETNTDYFNQPSNLISMQTKALPSQETLETVIVGKGNTEIELFFNHTSCIPSSKKVIGKPGEKISLVINLKIDIMITLFIGALWWYHTS